MNGWVSYTQEVEKLTEKTKRDTRERDNQDIRTQFAAFQEGYRQLRDEMYPLCKISKRRSDVYNKRVETWKESVNAFLLKRLGQKAMDDFRTVTFEYDHRECGRIEWIKKWLIELSDRLRRVDAQLDSYPRPS